MTLAYGTVKAKVKDIQPLKKTQRKRDGDRRRAARGQHWSHALPVFGLSRRSSTGSRCYVRPTRETCCSRVSGFPASKCDPLVSVHALECAKLRQESFTVGP